MSDDREPKRPKTTPDPPRADPEAPATGGVERFVAGPASPSPSPPGPTAPIAMPEPPPPIPPPARAPSAPMPPSPLAFQVAHFGDKGGGYGVFDEKGGIGKTFDSRADAEAFAAIRRKFFADLASGAAQAASTVPPPAPPAPPTAPGPTQWIPSPGERGFIGPMPAPPTPPPGPTPWIPSPGQPGFIGPMPAGHAPPPGPTPWIPSPGRPGFVGPMPAPPTPPPGPMHGPAAPTYRTMIDALGPALAHAFAAMPHDNGGQFHWQGLGQAAQMAGRVAPAAAGPAVVSSAQAAGWAAVGRDVARGFSRELGAAGGLLSVEGGLAKFADAVNESNRRLAPYSGTIAQAFTQLAHGDFRRGFQKAEATGDSAATLARSIDRMRDAWMPTEILQANLSNRIGIFGAEVGRINANVLGMGAGALNTVLDYVDKDGANSSLAGRAWGVTKFGLEGAALGRLAGPWGMAAGGLGGLALGFAADQMKADPAAVDPWGDFIRRADALPVLRPGRVIPGRDPFRALP